MFRGPFVLLALLFLVTLVMPLFLPIIVLFGYPMLAGIGLWLIARGLVGRLERPAEMAAVWMTYLGLILAVHGILIAADISLKGAPPSEEEKGFGYRLAYAGGTLAGLSVVAAYGLDLRNRRVTKAVKPGPLDDLMG